MEFDKASLLGSSRLMSSAFTVALWGSVAWENCKGWEWHDLHRFYHCFIDTRDVSVPRLSRADLPAITRFRLLTFKLLRLEYNLTSACLGSVDFSDFFFSCPIHIAC